MRARCWRCADECLSTVDVCPRCARNMKWLARGEDILAMAILAVMLAAAICW